MPAAAKRIRRRSVHVRRRHEEKQRDAHLVYLATPAAHGERVRELVQPFERVADPGERQVVRGRHVLCRVVLQDIPMSAGGGAAARTAAPRRGRRMQQPARRGLQALEQARGVEDGQRDRERVDHGRRRRERSARFEQALDVRLRLELHELAFAQARHDAHYLFLRGRVVAELLEQQRPGLVHGSAAVEATDELVGRAVDALLPPARPVDQQIPPGGPELSLPARRCAAADAGRLRDTRRG